MWNYIILQLIANEQGNQDCLYYDKQTGLNFAETYKLLLTISMESK